MQARISDDQVQDWLRDGHVVIEDFLSPDGLAAALADMAQYYPSWEDYAADPKAYEEIANNPFAMHEFPYRGGTLNDLTMHPEVLRVVEEQLGTPDIRLATGLIWGKYAVTKGLDQPLHVDFRNNTLVYPRDEGIYRQVPFILYLTDVTEDLGPTHVVSQTITGTDVATVSRTTFGDDPQDPPEDRRSWYAAERPVAVRAGSLLMYSMRTFHRGTAMRASEGVRLTLHMVYRSAACQFMGWRTPAKDGETAEMRQFLVRATPRQREVISFPAPGDPYWNDETLAGVAARYPEMDLSPYRSAGVTG